MVASSRPTSVLLLRQPVPMSQGTDAYHDAFGPFCLPSFALSALDTRTSTPSTPHNEPVQTGAQNAAMRDFIQLPKPNDVRWELPRKHETPHASYLMTHHLGHGESPPNEFCVISYPILSHVTVGQELLMERMVQLLQSPTKYDGVILTSQRAVQAWQESWSVLSKRLQRLGPLPPSSVWNKIPYYVVGPSTARALRDMDVPPFCRAQNVYGEKSGSGANLAQELIQRTETRSKSAARFLYLVGDKRTSSLRDTIEASGVPVELEEILVYKTSKDLKFESNCNLLERDLPQKSVSVPSSRRSSMSQPQQMTAKTPKVLQDSLKMSATTPTTTDDTHSVPAIHPDWIVFFSPSGGSYALPELLRRHWVSQGEYEPGKCKIACIGDTTAAWVRETLQYEPHAIAERPAAAALHAAIMSAVSKANTP